MLATDFIARWRAAELTERAAAQSHFLDLCALLGEDNPTDADPKGEWYAFEKGATKTTGGEGWADVWKRGYFGWEYKGKGKDLDAAYAQLQQYAPALENPPLLIVCDLDRFRDPHQLDQSVSEVHEIRARRPARSEKVRRAQMGVVRPRAAEAGQTRQALTEEAAGEFADPGATPARARPSVADGRAFHQSAGVLHVRRGCRSVAEQDVRAHARGRGASPDEFAALASSLVCGHARRADASGSSMSNGSTAACSTTTRRLPLTREDIALVREAASRDWAEIDPSIFGTLFERGLDPGQASQLGAHYTDRDKIMLIVAPVVTRPWLAEWEAARAEIEKRTRQAEIAADLDRGGRRGQAAVRTRALNEANALYRGFLDRLRAFRVLDPACGSGNFLYLALLALKDIEHRVAIEAESLGLAARIPAIGPEAVKGIEINPYAAELARVTVWIGEIQWMRRNGFDVGRNPILKPLDTIECRDAILNEDGSEADWPPADVVIGNPPFLGAHSLIATIGEFPTSVLRLLFSGRLTGNCDFVVYWFEKASELLISGKIIRFGLVATQSIRRPANREPLQRRWDDIKLFEAWSDIPWTVDGADVRVLHYLWSTEITLARFATRWPYRSENKR